MIIESELQMSKDTSKVMKIYLELRKNYEALNDELNIKNISEKISSLEANNNMDKTRAISLREEAYSYAENKNYKNSTKIIISQRISSIINCDKIMVIEDGKITNIDTHENLLKISKIYREFYEIQKGGGNFDEQ